MINRRYLEPIILVAIVISIIFFIPILFGSFSSTKGLEEKENIKDTAYRLKDKVNLEQVEVYISKEKKVKKIPLEEYVLSVVSSEMPASFNEEALKAQAVLARTFVINKLISSCSNIEEGNVCDTTHCQVYMDLEKRKELWGEGWEKNLKKIEDAVEETEGEVLTYEEKIIKYPQYFSTSSGKTEEAIAVFSEYIPYLKSVESKGEEISPKFESEVVLTFHEFKNRAKEHIKDVKISNNLKEDLEIISRNKGDTVNEVKVGNKIIKGKEFRKIFSLNSANFTFEFLEGKIKIKVKGYGHGVGMSQWGANVMRKEGKTYESILSHYFKESNIEKVDKVLI